jgi:hypothetical protein
MLDGVGEGNPTMLPPGPVLHMFKKLTASEMARVNKVFDSEKLTLSLTDLSVW